MSDKKGFKRKRKKEGEGGLPLWMQTYSDMVTLLLAFFILLFSMSIIDEESFRQVMAAVQTSFTGHPSILDEGRDIEEEDEYLPHTGDEAPMDPQVQELLEQWEEAREIMEEVEDFLAEEGLQDEVEPELVADRGIVMHLPDKLLFYRAQAELKPEAWSLLEELADLLREIPSNVLVEGHTCNLPISTAEFPSNWELSAMRAVTVVRYLVEEEGLEPEQLQAIGYGEHHPVASNETEEGRERNRRVTIVISVF